MKPRWLRKKPIQPPVVVNIHVDAKGDAKAIVRELERYLQTGVQPLR